MKIDIELLQEAFINLATEVYKRIVQFVSDYWEQIEELTVKYMEYKLEQPQPKVYGYVKHKVMKSQIIDRKPRCIRARTVC
ncbi:hypothetical protein OB969_21755 [Bacillus cereus]|uniref:hypothetical protein n=1 Tax=Bacillus cereus TaxID=1396 RepID=UPI0007AB2214|nr:hypothetical protein [Bacillus cereus]KZD45893.1 hypothetical protein B4084_3646 [Bacillus cereus]MCU5053234.1 hypothetical protein [Bacillus cereus]MCU5192557.1 hypothetical protein [Bacillus cereus]